MAVVQLNFWLNTFLASYQPEGSLAAITFAFPLMIMPEAAIAQSIAIAALPTFSAQAARGKLEEMRASLAATLRGVLMLALPASLGLILLRQPLVDMIYQRDAFTAHRRRWCRGRCCGMQPGWWGTRWLKSSAAPFMPCTIQRRLCWSVSVRWGSTWSSACCLPISFGRAGLMPHGGLALANSLATFLEMAALLVLMRGKLSGLDGRRILPALLKAALATLGMGAALWGWLSLDVGGALVTTLGGVAVGGLAYLGMLVVLRVDELRSGFGLVRRLVAARLKR